MTNLTGLTKDELYQRIKDATDELIAREIEEVKPLKTEKRVANVGEKIVITDARITCGYYKNGDVLTVNGLAPSGRTVYVEEFAGNCVLHKEYEVLVEEEPKTFADSLECFSESIRKAVEATSDNFEEAIKAFTPIETKSPNQQRAELIQRAKAFVEDNWDVHLQGRPDFKFKESKRRVTCLIKGTLTGMVYSVGRANCHPDDVFNADIGKAIALARALEIEIPEEFLDAVQPDEKVVGMVVDWDGRVREISKKVDSGKTCFLGSITSNAGSIINDTNAEYPNV